jgi:hypothetical protein
LRRRRPTPGCNHNRGAEARRPLHATRQVEQAASRMARSEP